MIVWVLRIGKYVFFLGLIAAIIFRSGLGENAATRWQRLASASALHAPELTVLALKAEWSQTREPARKVAILKNLAALNELAAVNYYASELERTGQAGTDVLTLLLSVKAQDGLPIPETAEAYEYERLIGLLLEKEPDNPTALQLKAELFSMRSFDDRESLASGIELFGRLARSNQDDLRTQVRLAQLHARAGQFDVAEQIRTKILSRLGRTNAHALLVSAEIQQYLGRHGQAELELQLALQQGSKDDAVLRQAAELFARMGQYPLALECWQKLLDSKGGDPEIYAYRASALLYSNRPSEALEAVTAGLQVLDGNNSYSEQQRTNLNMFLQLRGALARLVLRETLTDPTQREALLSQAREIMRLPVNDRAFRWLRDTVQGYLALVDGKIEAANTAFDRAIRSSPPRSDLSFIALMAANTSLAAAQPYRTLQLTGMLLAVSPENKGALMLHARALLALGRPGEAAQTAEKLLQLEPESEGMQKLLSAALLMTGQEPDLIALSRLSGLSKEQLGPLLLLDKLRRAERSEYPELIERLKPTALAQPELAALLVRELLQRGEREQADTLLQAVMPRHPEDRRLKSLQIIVNETNPQKRVELLSAAVRESLEGYEREVALGFVYLTGGDRQRAVEAFEAAQKIRPDDVYVRRQLFQLYLDAGVWEQAEAQLKELKNANADGLGGALLETSYHTTRQGYDRALNVLTQALQQYPENAQLLATYANTLTRSGRVDEAIKALDRSLIANPNYLPSLLTRASLKLNKGSYEAAEADLLRVQQIDRSMVQTYEVLAGIKLKTNQPEEARKILESAKAAGFETDVLQILNVRTLLELQKYKEAGSVVEQWAKKAIRPQAIVSELLNALLGAYREQTQSIVGKWKAADPNDPVAALLHAALALQSEHAAAVQSSLDALQARLPKDSPYRAFLLKLESSLAMNEQRWNDAYQLYLEILQLEPDELMALNNSCYLLSERLERPAAALPYGLRATIAYPRHAAVWDTYGVALLRNDKLTEAEEAFRKSLSLGTTSSALLGLARLQLKLQRFGDAQQTAEQALAQARKEPGSAEIADAADKLLKELKHKN